jgi:hypothetical protein
MRQHDARYDTTQHAPNTKHHECLATIVVRCNVMARAPLSKQSLDDRSDVSDLYADTKWTLDACLDHVQLLVNFIPACQSHHMQHDTRCQAPYNLSIAD